MRLWHIDLIPFLPKSQLLAQWRELNSIFKKEDKHILINYIYEYEKRDLLAYTNEVIREMRKRGFNIKSFEKMNTYFENITLPPKEFKPFARDHNDEYIEICYYNLKEKFIRGQKDFDKELFQQLHHYYKSKKKQN